VYSVRVCVCSACVCVYAVCVCVCVYTHNFVVCLHMLVVSYLRKSVSSAGTTTVRVRVRCTQITSCMLTLLSSIYIIMYRLFNKCALVHISLLGRLSAA